MWLWFADCMLRHSILLGPANLYAHVHVLTHVCGIDSQAALPCYPFESNPGCHFCQLAAEFVQMLWGAVRFLWPRA
jgi:hypothetical protein